MLISKKDELDNLIAHIQQLMHEASEREEFKEASEYKKKVAQLTEERNKIKKELDQLGYKDDDTDEAIEVDKLSSSGTLSSSPSPPPSSPSQSTPSSRSGTSNQFAQMKPPETTPHVEETSYFIPAKKPTSKTRFADEVQIGQKSKPLIRRSQSTFGGSLSKKGGVKLLDKDSAESTAFEKSESEFFSAIVKASKNILIETKKLTSIDSSTTEEQVLDGAKNTAKATIGFF